MPRTLDSTYQLRVTRSTTQGEGGCDCKGEDARAGAADRRGGDTAPCRAEHPGPTASGTLGEARPVRGAPLLPSSVCQGEVGTRVPIAVSDPDPGGA